MTDIKPLKLNEGHFLPIETRQMCWIATAPYGATREHSLQSVFWTHVSRKLRPLSKVTVIAEDGSWYQELLCLVVDGADIRMKELHYWQLADTSDVREGVPTSDRTIEWAGPHHMFRVIRKSDDYVLAKGFHTREDAHKWVSANTSARA